MSTLPEFSQRLVECAGMFRLGQEIRGAGVMVELFADLAPLFLEREAWVQAQWAGLLQSMLVDQQAQNWLGLADSLEYDLVDLLIGQPHA